MTENTQNPTSLPLVVHAQYVKDLSFEVPMGLAALRSSGPAPDMNVSVNLDIQNVPDEKLTSLFEVTMQFRIRATRGDTPLFLVDLDYVLSVSVDGIPEQNRHAVLLVEVPRLGFPFARQIIAECVQNGGFPAVYLTPMDFAALYMDRFSKDKAVG
jgi:preprotein translocase subunit SecB